MEKCQNQNFSGKNEKALKKGYFLPNTIKYALKLVNIRKLHFLLISRNLAFSELFRSLYISIYLAGVPIDKQMFDMVI